MRRTKNSEKAATVRVVAVVLFILYFYILIKNSIFTRLITKNYMRGLSLIPFKSAAFKLDAYTDGLSFFFSTGFKSLIASIMMFIPMGFLLPFILPGERHFLKILGISFFTSIAIELLQYITKSGVSSIDDLILAIAGALLGLLLHKILRFAFYNS